MTTSASGSPPFAVLVPVKRTALAKSRLGSLGPLARQGLASAFAMDTVTAVLACHVVARVLVVTDDHLLARSLHDLGADVIPDGTTDLNGTLVQAAEEMQRRDPALRLAAVCADLPALRAEELAEAFGATDSTVMSFVSDEERMGTTAVIAPSLATFHPAFGHGSRRQHLEKGAFEVDGIDVPGLRRDVDDPTDLREALRLGVGSRTSLVAATLGFSGADSRQPSARAMQATVSAFDEVTRDGRVLFDDGREMSFPAAALEGSGLLLLRPGQRVRLQTEAVGEDRRIVGVQILTLH
jgi:2-phospho-L-lactate guanylyltransferase